MTVKRKFAKIAIDPPAKIAKLPAMGIDQDIYREWLRVQLAARGRGSRKELAQYLGFSRPDPITRMLNADPGKETREISAVELARMVEFFDAPPPKLPPDGPPNAQRLFDDAFAMYERLSPSLQREFFLRALQPREAAQTAAAPPVPRRSSEK